MEDEFIMEMCLEEAEKAFDEGEVPVGAVVISPEGRSLAKAHNLTIHANSPTAHAELLAINEAARALGTTASRVAPSYVTMEPCIMCAGAMVEARIKKVVFGCFDAKRGGLCSVVDINDTPLEPQTGDKRRST